MTCNSLTTAAFESTEFSGQAVNLEQSQQHPILTKLLLQCTYTSYQAWFISPAAVFLTQSTIYNLNSEPTYITESVFYSALIMKFCLCCQHSWREVSACFQILLPTPILVQRSYMMAVGGQSVVIAGMIMMELLLAMNCSLGSQASPMLPPLPHSGEYYRIVCTLHVCIQKSLEQLVR